MKLKWFGILSLCAGILLFVVGLVLLVTAGSSGSFIMILGSILLNVLGIVLLSIAPKKRK
mgnify:CR=1 FL=1